MGEGELRPNQYVDTPEYYGDHLAELLVGGALTSMRRPQETTMNDTTLPLAGQVALVTGASSGLGPVRAVAPPACCCHFNCADAASSRAPDTRAGTSARKRG